MFNFSFYELMVFGIIALIILGPEKLPQAVRTLGTYYAKFTRTVSTLKAEMEAELDLAETRQQMQAELEKIRQAEVAMQQEMAQFRGTMKQFEQQAKHFEQSGDLSSETTRPWENMWFLLSDYDRAKRLPPAPRLPNYTPDPLLNAQPASITQTQTQMIKTAETAKTTGTDEISP